MTKKHFIALAHTVREINNRLIRDSSGSYEAFAERAIYIVESELANFCKSQNGDFKRERWLGYIRGENGPSGGRV